MYFPLPFIPLKPSSNSTQPLPVGITTLLFVSMRSFLSFFFSFFFAQTLYRSSQPFPGDSIPSPPFPPLPIFYNLYLFLFLEREEGRKKNTGCLSHLPPGGPNLPPRHMPRLGIKLAAFCFVGWCSTN